MSQYEEEYREFLRKLRLARTEAGFTQKDVSKLLNKPQSYVSKCESGERRVDIIELKAFARLYRKPIEDFMAND